MVEKMIKNVLLGILGFILLLTLVGAAAPTLITALNNVAGSGLPLASLFSSTGIVAMIFIFGVIIGVIVLVFKVKYN